MIESLQSWIIFEVCKRLREMGVFFMKIEVKSIDAVERCPLTVGRVVTVNA